MRRYAAFLRAVGPMNAKRSLARGHRHPSPPARARPGAPSPGPNSFGGPSGPTSSPALAAAAPAALSPSSSAPPPPRPSSSTCGSPPGLFPSLGQPPRPSSASGECRPSPETRTRPERGWSTPPRTAGRPGKLPGPTLPSSSGPGTRLPTRLPLRKPPLFFLGSHAFACASTRGGYPTDALERSPLIARVICTRSDAFDS
jgi:hypothetical protein